MFLSACSRCPHAAKEHGGLVSMGDEKVDALLLKLKERLALKKSGWERKTLLEVLALAKNGCI